MEFISIKEGQREKGLIMQKGIQLNAAIFSDQGDLSVDEFLDAFIVFIESKRWNLGGLREINDEFIAVK